MTNSVPTDGDKRQRTDEAPFYSGSACRTLVFFLRSVVSVRGRLLRFVKAVQGSKRSLPP